MPKAFVLLRATPGICAGWHHFFFFFPVKDSYSAIGKILLGCWSLKWVPRTRAPASLGNSLEMLNLRPHLSPTEPDILRGRTSGVCSNQAFGRLCCRLKLENHGSVAQSGLHQTNTWGAFQPGSRPGPTLDQSRQNSLKVGPGLPSLLTSSYADLVCHHNWKPLLVRSPALLPAKSHSSRRFQGCKQ